MKIHTVLKLNEAGLMDETTSELFSGWVELDSIIKFPVKVRRYEKDGEKKMFVAYPQRKTADGYVNVVFPHDKETREMIQDNVLRECQETLKRVYSAAYRYIDEVNITLLPPRTEPVPVALHAYATVKMLGITISGIAVKEGTKGLFVQMPQHKSGNEYKDTVYGVSRSAQESIKEAVLEAYKEKILKVQPKPEQVPEPEPKPEEEPEAEELLSKPIGQPKPEKVTRQVQHTQEEGLALIQKAYQERDLQMMMKILARTEMDVSLAEFTSGNMVAVQEARITSGAYELKLQFANQYDLKSEIPAGKELQQYIMVEAFDNGEYLWSEVFKDCRAANREEAKKNYDDVLQHWKNLTNQKEIYSGKVVVKQPEVNQPKPAPGMRM